MQVQKRVFIWVLLISILVYIFCSFFALHKPFNCDEVDFADVAGNIKLSGMPVFYIGKGIEKDGCNLSLYSVEKHLGYGLWHPPLYVNLLALWFKLLGESFFTGRLFGLFCALISLILSLAIIRELCIYENCDKESRFLVCVLFCILYLINPLIIQFSLLLDVDNSILTVLMLLFFYVFFKSYAKDRFKDNFILGLIFGASLLAKLTTPLFIPISIFIFYLINREIKKAFQKTFVIGFLGIIFFWSVWSSYAALFHLPFNFPFVFNYGTKITPALGNRLLFSWPLVKATLISIMSWLSPAFAVLLLCAIAAQILKSVKKRYLSPLMLLVIFSATVFFMYTAVWPRILMMKYHSINNSLFIIIIVFLFLRYFKEYTPRELIISFIIALILLVAMSYVFADSIILAQYWRAGQIKTPLVALYLSPVLIVPLGLSVLLSGKLKAKYLVLGLLVCVLAYNISLDFKQIMPYVTINDWNNYGEAGLKEAMDYLDRNLSAEGALICRKDIGYYVKEITNHPKREWYPTYNLFGGSPQQANEAFLKAITEDNIEYIELDAQFVAGRSIPHSLYNYYLPDKKIGSFFILKKK